MQRAGLAQRDMELFTSIAVALGSIRVTATLRKEAVRLIPKLVETTLIAWNESDHVTGVIAVEIAPDHTDYPSDADFLAAVAEHPVMTRYARTRDGRPWAISDFLDTPAYHATRIYQSFYRLIGAEDQISFVVPEPGRLIGITLNRDRSGFSQRDRTLLNLLRPVLAQAHRNATAAERVDQVLARIGTAAERSDEGIVALDRRGHGEFVGRRSQDLVRHWFGERMTAAPPRPLEHWLRTTRRRPGPAWPFVLERDGRRLVVRLLASGTGEVLLLSESDLANFAAVTTQLGLTPREIQVMELVSQIVPTGAIAHRLRISQGTVYKHVQNSLDKLGASSRTEAVNLLRQAEYET